MTVRKQIAHNERWAAYYKELKKRIDASPHCLDICTCLIGSYGPYWRLHKDRKCCICCPGCGSRVKRSHLAYHGGKCVAYREKFPMVTLPELVKMGYTSGKSVKQAAP